MQHPPIPARQTDRRLGYQCQQRHQLVMRGSSYASLHIITEELLSSCVTVTVIIHGQMRFVGSSLVTKEEDAAAMESRSGTSQTVLLM
ncbi:hypothetical protein INR49_000425 [Caranx melampygus]|nr:hypothetical protein INR49_000425 [Caranx melampygus]